MSDQDSTNMPDQISELLRVHEASTAAFRAGLLQRSAGEVLYDDYLLAQLSKGKAFKVALRKANAKFPSQALNPSDTDLADVEEHYRFFLRMQQVDGYASKLEETERKIRATDKKIAELLEQWATQPPETVQPAETGDAPKP